MYVFSSLFISRPVTRGGAGVAKPLLEKFSHPWKMFWTKFKSLWHSVKNLSPSPKTLRPLCVPSWLRACFSVFLYTKCLNDYQRDIRTKFSITFFRQFSSRKLQVVKFPAFSSISTDRCAKICCCGILLHWKV